MCALQNPNSMQFSCRTRAGDTSRKRSVSILSPYGRRHSQNGPAFAVQLDLLFEHQDGNQTNFHQSNKVIHCLVDTARHHKISYRTCLRSCAHSRHRQSALPLFKPLTSVAAHSNGRNVAACVDPEPSQNSHAVEDGCTRFKIQIPCSSRVERGPATLLGNTPFPYYHHTDDSTSKMSPRLRYSLTSCLRVTEATTPIFSIQTMATIASSTLPNTIKCHIERA